MSFFGGLFNDIQNAVSNAVKTVTNDVKNVANDIAHPIETGSGQLFSDIQNALKNVTKETTNVVNGVKVGIGHLGKVVHNDLATIQHELQHVISPIENIPRIIINPIEHAGHLIQNGLAKLPGETLSDVQHALAAAYHATRVGLTDLFTGAAATGREVGDLIRYHHFIPFSQAIKDVENQSVANTPIFSPLARFGIKTGSQLFNVESQFAANIIPITGTFGHLAAHPGESLGSKISDIAFGIADLIPGIDVAAGFLRPADVGAEAALAGLRAADVGGEAGSDLLNPLAKDLGSETTDLSPAAERDILNELDLEKNAERDLGKETQAERNLTEEGNIEKDLERSRLRNRLLKISKYGTLAAIGVGVGVPLALSLFGGKGGSQTTQNYPIPSSPSSPSPYLPAPKGLPNPSSPTNLPSSNGITGLYNPFTNGIQAQEVGTVLQNQSTAASPNAPGAVPGTPSSPSSPGVAPSSPSSPSSPSGSGGFLTSLIHNKFFLIGIIVIILIIIGIIIMR
jgi:hypothetical protein